MAIEIYSTGQIRERLPFRYPMLLLDRAWKESESKYFGLKAVTVNEEFFVGHFPVQPIMPGVLQVEATYQLAALAVTDKLNPDKTLDVYLKSIKDVKFRKPTFPGDRLLIEIDIVSLTDTEAVVAAVNKNNSGVCCQAELTLSVRPCIYNVKKPELFTQYDRTDTTAMDLKTIKSYIPHRYPFLFIDYIAKAEGQSITAIKNITSNECLMHSYSPGYSVLSGAIQCEIIAQAGCAHTLASPENKGKLAYFMTISKAEFYKPIHPGDQLRIELLLPPAKKFGKGKGEIFVENELVSSGEISFAIVDQKPEPVPAKE
jgi:3-hydroxyacyl-[acyl-carrier-protein] dehydratase